MGLGSNLLLHKTKANWRIKEINVDEEMTQANLSSTSDQTSFTFYVKCLFGRLNSGEISLRTNTYLMRYNKTRRNWVSSYCHKDRTMKLIRQS
ncbi:hypothetical protein YC2023_053947 [Brassica napus]